MKLTPVNIKTQEFTKSLRGYDDDEVNTFLGKIASEVEILLSENESLKNEIEELNARLDDYVKLEKDLQSARVKKQNFSAESNDSAKKQTETLLKEAQLKANQIIENAKESANEIRNAVINLREEKNLIISKLKAIVNTQANLLEGKVKRIDEIQQDQEKTKQHPPKDDLDVDVDDIVNKLL